MPIRDSDQPSLFHDDAEKFTGDLKALVGGPVRVRIHDNRSTMVSLRRSPDALELRVHHMFVAAEPEVIRALADYARAQSPKSGEVIQDFVRRNKKTIRPATAEPLRRLGTTHDVQAIFDALNQRYFDGAIDARVGWGRGTAKAGHRSMRMGVYFQESRTILVHQALDSPQVPKCFVELVVYHEMLHQAVPEKRDYSGRRAVHSREFKRREKLFADYDQARAWERQNVDFLLRGSAGADDRRHVR